MVSNPLTARVYVKKKLNLKWIQFNKTTFSNPRLEINNKNLADMDSSISSWRYKNFSEENIFHEFICSLSDWFIRCALLP
jgi:hypothetical protein